MKNKYEIRGDVTAIFINNKTLGEVETLISTDQLEKVDSFPNTWFAIYNRTSKTYYVVGNGQRLQGRNKMVQLHRLITDAPDGMYVDHINHKTLDNTNENLRVITPAQNTQNLSGARACNKCGIRGVSWDKDRRKWKVQIAVNGKKIHIGLFLDIKDAEIAAIESRHKYMPYAAC